MKEYLSVKEFSRLSGIENTTLRYWDEIGLFSPAKRDPENNYRYYTPQQVIAVKFITVLSHLDVPLKAIAKMEIERNPEKIMDLIEQRESILDMEMRRLREAYSIIHTRRELIKFGMKVDLSKVSVCRLEEKAIILGPPCEFQEGQPFYEPFTRFCRQAEELRVNLGYPIGGYHAGMETFLKAPGQPDHFFSMDPTGNKKRAAGEYLVGYTRGYYGKFGDLPARMAAYAEEHALSLIGPVYTIYLHDEICIRDHAQYLSQLSVAVAKR